MIRTLVIDDEKDCRDTTISMLREYFPKILVEGEADDVESGIAAILKYQPDLIILDICLGEGSAFDILNRFDPIDFRLIFMTELKEYALKAIKYSAIDYLLKPVSLDDLRSAIEKVEMLAMRELQLQVTELKQNMPAKPANRIVLRTADKLHLIQVNQIVRCEANRNYSNFYLRNKKKIVVSSPMKVYEKLLLDQGFFRLHKSHIVNISFIESYIKSDGGQVILTDGTRIPVADRKKAALMDLFNRFR
ncbi:MAG TPA: LytTR family DNA-binding domain-containing protein [Bacteroidales bacterium]|nr:LytTR family DNA-binding domain-containing protein [Bacteroidales bacterium]